MSYQQSYHETFALADLYELLHIATDYPSAALAVGLCEGSIRDDVRAILGELGVCEQTRLELDAVYAASFSGCQPEIVLSTLRREYTRLFTHPKTPALYPYEALFLHVAESRGGMLPRLFTSEAALSAASEYKRAGLRHNPGAGKNLSPDHVSIELEFTGILLRKHGEARRNAQGEAGQSASVMLERFKTLHLAKWLRIFFQELDARTTSAEYRYLSKVGCLATELLEI